MHQNKYLPSHAFEALVAQCPTIVQPKTQDKLRRRIGSNLAQVMELLPEEARVDDMLFYEHGGAVGILEYSQLIGQHVANLLRLGHSKTSLIENLGTYYLTEAMYNQNGTHIWRSKDGQRVYEHVINTH